MTAAAPSPRPERRRTPRLVEVVDVMELTPRMVRVEFGGVGLEGFSAGEFTDHYVKIQFPPADADYAAPFDQEEIRATRPRERWPRTRTYSVRSWDAERVRLTVDFVVHGDEGVAGPWARQATPGTGSSYKAPVVHTRPISTRPRICWSAIRA